MKEPNIILISLDTLRADKLSCYGYDIPTSLNIDKLAKNGILFMNAFTNAPSTPPAHASLLTGLYPSKTGLFIFPEIGSHQDYYYLNQEIDTMADIHSDNNYLSTAFTGGGWVSKAIGLNKGFYSFVENESPTTNDLLQNCTNALDWIEKNRGFKFFLFLHTYEIHRPYNHHYFSEIKEYYKMPHTKASYDSGILYTDLVLDIFIKELKRMKAYDNTIIIITSDHGETHDEHNNISGYTYNHGGSFFDEEIKVPLIFHYPLKFKPKKVNKIVGLVDVLPTLLDILKINSRSGELDGDSLLPLINGERINSSFRDYVFVESPAYGLSRCCIRTENYKLIKVIKRIEIFEEDANKSLSNHPSILFYDLKLDPLERKRVDLLRYKKEIEKLENLINLLNTKHNVIELLKFPFKLKMKKGGLSDKEKEKLRSLGYLK